MSRAVFTTLTYPDNFPAEPDRWKRDLDTFLKRVARAYPDAYGIWRLECKARKSGKNRGKVAPHYHLLVCGIKNLKEWREFIQTAWFEVVGSGDAKHAKAGTEASRVQTSRHAMHYVSKYCAKMDDDTPITAEGEPMPIGKWWGKFGDADNAPSLSMEIGYEELCELRRLAARYVQNRNKRYSKIIKRGKMGLTIFGLGDESNPAWLKQPERCTGWGLVMAAVFD